MNQSEFKILLAVTGSVGARYIPNLVKALIETNEPYKFEVRVVVTKNAKYFIDLTTTVIPPTVLVYDESSEWAWRKFGDPIAHIELRKWADLLVIAPLSANSLAKLAQGICDNLLTSTVRAWDLAKPCLFCPTMNDVMWNHPITQIHTDTLKNWGYKEVPPIVKMGMCGEVGMGGFPGVETIVEEIKIICGQIIDGKV